MQNYSLKLRGGGLCAFGFRFLVLGGLALFWGLVSCGFAAELNVDSVCELIYQGKFDAVGELIEKSGQEQQAPLSRLADIVKEYQGINERRRLARETAYKEQLAELEKLKLKTKADDANDANGISKAFVVISKLSESANEKETSVLVLDSNADKFTASILLKVFSGLRKCRSTFY